MKKLTYFCAMAKENHDHYRSVKDFLKLANPEFIFGNQDKMDKDNNVITVSLSYLNEGDTEDKHIRYIFENLQMALDYLKEHHKDLFDQIPVINIPKFEFIAKNAKCSTSLTYQYFVETDTPEYIREGFFYVELDQDDIVDKTITPEQYLDKLVTNRVTTTLQCYPNTPVGFWSYYGFDFNSLLDHVIED